MSKRKSRDSSTGKDKKKGKDGKSKIKSKSNKNNGNRPKRRVQEIVFDPEARKDYLCGFSERKKQRRAYGLAMQKVKDRKARIEQRADLKQSIEEQIKEAEERKRQLLKAASNTKAFASHQSDNDSDDDDESEVDSEEQKQQQQQKQQHDNDTNIEDDKGGDCNEFIEKSDKGKDEAIVQVYEDAKIKKQWGGDVIVTTTINFDDIDGDEDYGEDEKEQKPNQHRTRKAKDAAQEYSGKVERFLRQIKGSMPSKKDSKTNTKHRGGRHGAANMPGIGGDANLKAAKKILSRTQSKAARPTHGGDKHKKKKQRSK